MQAGLDLGSVKELVVLAPHHIREASQVSYDGSRALLPIQPQEHPFHWKGMGLAVALNGCDRPAQFYPVFAIARVAERGEPLMGMRVEAAGDDIVAADRCPGAATPAAVLRAEGFQRGALDEAVARDGHHHLAGAEIPDLGDIIGDRQLAAIDGDSAGGTGAITEGEQRRQRDAPALDHQAALRTGEFADDNFARLRGSTFDQQTAAGDSPDAGRDCAHVKQTAVQDGRATQNVE